MPGLTLGDTIPNLEVETTHGRTKLHDYIGDRWTIIFSHPGQFSHFSRSPLICRSFGFVFVLGHKDFLHVGDFTPVCTTELGKMAAYTEEFARREVKLLGLSCDEVQSHKEWIKDIEAYTVIKTFFFYDFRLSSSFFAFMAIDDGTVCCLCLQPGSKVTYPIAADPKREIIKQLNMVDPDEKDSSGNNLPSRALHIVGPDKKVSAASSKLSSFLIQKH